ncbi:hypothetical protein IX38_12435 [Chryseobacterium luteum]|uniref:Uncharacterized protein n=1 Tax=Chryseobacterium luteum TaxID=421531 RepID=A0A085ZEA8_9FLAO|nr:hypothetical protein IX38_12435 [Chryseobacterium luteum]
MDIHTSSETDTSTRVPLLPLAQELILKYENHPESVNSNILFPVLSNQKMNSFIRFQNENAIFTNNPINISEK